MSAVDVSSEGLRALHKAAVGLLPATGLGLVREDDPDHRILTYVDAFGTTAHRVRSVEVPEAFRPGASALLRVTAAELETNPSGVVESRLLHTGFSDDIRRQFGARQVFALTVRDSDRSAVLLMGFGESGPPTVAQVSEIESLAARVDFLKPVESPERELALLRRLDAVECLLPDFFRAPDVGEIVDRLSGIAGEALRHDFASLAILSEDLQAIQLSFHTPRGSSYPEGSALPYPAVQTAAFLYRFVDDVTTHPIEHNLPAAKAGRRSSVEVSIRRDEAVVGLLTLASRDLVPFSATDVIVARRVADQVGLALSYHEVAGQSRHMATWQERAARLERLGGLLQELAGVLDLRAVFHRVSDIAKQVLPCDAIGLPLITEDREHVIPFATLGFPAGTFPPIQPLNDFFRSLMVKSWDFQIFDDMQAEFDLPDEPVVKLGYRSVLRVPVRLQGEFTGVLVFLSRTVAAYSHADVLVAQRIADHIALAISHQRLAEEARRNEELRARTTNLELLDELLTTLIDSGDLRDVFERISAIAGKVLRHDALALWVCLADGRHARVYASSGFQTAVPDVIEIPDELIHNPDWEHDLLDDLSIQADKRYLEIVRMGFRSLLRVPIRLDNRFAGALIFFGANTSTFKPDDFLAARRMADRMAVTLARDRQLEALRRADEATARASRLEVRVRALTEELDARTGYRRVVGESREWRQVLTQAAQVAPTDTTVLLSGESGTGKEVIARFLHRGSSRSNGPFVALNCAALPEQLLEAELFGYERGAYTGATQSKPGQLEQASGGTLFLDEVAEMSPSAQAKFLRVLQEREFQRLGGLRVLRTDARVVAATNRDLSRAIAQGQFREDLYYRLNVFAIRLPALRERRDDILPLSDAFLNEIGRGLGRPPGGISREVRKLLLEYHWPGNVRELRNILERAAILCDGGLITLEHIAIQAAPVPPTPAPAATPVVTAPGRPAPPSTGDLQMMERGMIEQALEAARFNKSKAAKALGLTRHQLYIRMRRHGLEA